ncbi:PAN2-PAN3 deadenylation complex subunit PAN3 [Mycena venus]|uniref:PAN2-PAN3 deadenylation complex subunit PAN3 n=1 Tax=Mycena venus TaxID=2733690 RepID=A0A8H6WRK7_9AGAR|nr:PAN2-PAN3 deadenylation complex subunit PAN3 [Mycena venus]
MWFPFAYAITKPFPSKYCYFLLGFAGFSAAAFLAINVFLVGYDVISITTTHFNSTPGLGLSKWHSGSTAFGCSPHQFQLGDTFRTNISAFSYSIFDVKASDSDTGGSPIQGGFLYANQELNSCDVDQYEIIVKPGDRLITSTASIQCPPPLGFGAVASWSFSNHAMIGALSAAMFPANSLARAITDGMNNISNEAYQDIYNRLYATNDTNALSQHVYKVIAEGQPRCEASAPFPCVGKIEISGGARRSLVQQEICCNLSMAFFARPQSANAAIKIVRPTTADDDQPKPATRKDSVQRHCRNIMIYGCAITSLANSRIKVVSITTLRRAPDAVPFAPQAESPAKSVSPTLTAKAVNAPVFVPKLAVSIQTSTPPPENPPSPQPQYHDDQQEAYNEYAYPAAGVDSLTDQMQEMSSDSFYADASYDPYDPTTENPYFATQAPVFVRQPLNYHLYTSAIPSAFVSSASDTHFIPPSSDLRTLLQGRSEDLRIAPTQGLNLPEEMQGYHSLMPLENITGSTERRKFGNWNSTVYRAINSLDGGTYCLRRIENYRLNHQAAFAAIEAWANIRHPGVVAVHEAFTTHAFGDSSLVVAYAYHPKAQTLFDAHLKLTPPAYQHGTRVFQPTPQAQIPERTLWSYIVQLAGAIKRVHDAGQALRMIDVTKDVHLLQQEDLTMFGRLVFALCTGNVMASSGGNFQKSLEVMGRLYSPEVKTVALFLVNKGGPHRSIGQLLEIISSRVAAEMGDALSAADTLENELMGELENARLVRLLCKFGFINERPEFAREPRWSETGDRYIIKLFRDYVFHQVDENGNPVVNLSHVLTCLSKLDAGTDERVMLISRDEQSCLVVSYKDIKSCVESAFSELARAGTSANTAAAGGYR